MEILRGTVAESPMYPRNGGVIRCVFMLHVAPKDGQGVRRGTMFRVISEPGATREGQPFFRKGDRVTVVGKTDGEIKNPDFSPLFRFRADVLNLEKIACPEVQPSVVLTPPAPVSVEDNPSEFYGY